MLLIGKHTVVLCRHNSVYALSEKLPVLLGVALLQNIVILKVEAQLSH